MADPTSNYKLMHIVNLLLAEQCAFVMKKPDGTYDDGEMICAFNRNGFLKPEDIFSNGKIIGMTYKKRYIVHKMVITRYSTIFRGNDEQWNYAWSYPKIWDSEVPYKNDLDSYRYLLEEPKVYRQKIDYFIRIYLKNIEVRYPGYVFYLKEYLGLL